MERREDHPGHVPQTKKCRMRRGGNPVAVDRPARRQGSIERFFRDILFRGKVQAFDRLASSCNWISMMDCFVGTHRKAKKGQPYMYLNLLPVSG